ncbi:MAG: hypothetical protein IAE95_03910 [Chitinophagaceae bacterium]|nr:hypothetical protein [Chitinophagaceae bacterium]
MFQRIVLVFLPAIFVLSEAAFSQSDELLAVRELYYRSVKDEEAAKKLCAIPAGEQVPASIIAGYKAVGKIMMCNHVGNPYTKLKYFYAGRDALEKSIAAAPVNVELRYLRYAVQRNTPSLLHYNGSIATDRQMIERYLADERNKDTDPDLYERIRKYMTTYK